MFSLVMGLNSGGPKEGEELSSSRRSKGGGAAWEPPAALPADLTIAAGLKQLVCPLESAEMLGRFFFL